MLVFCFFINLKFVKKFDRLTQSAFFGNRYEPTTTLGAGPRLHKRLNYPSIFYNNVCQLIVWKTVDASDIFSSQVSIVFVLSLIIVQTKQYYNIRVGAHYAFD